MTKKEKEAIASLCDIIQDIIAVQAREAGVAWCSEMINKTAAIKKGFEQTPNTNVKPTP